jgi:ABC-2 type transport system permease protein
MTTILWSRLLHLRKNWIIVGLMIILPLVFTFAFGGLGGSPQVTLPVVDLDQTLTSGRLVTGLAGHPQFMIEPVTMEQAITLVAENQVELAVVIPKGFSQQLEARQNPEIELVKTKDSMLTVTVENTLKTSIKKLQVNIQIAEIAAGKISALTGITDQEKPALAARAFYLAEEHWEKRRPIQIVAGFAGENRNHAFESLVHSQIGLILMFSIFMISLTLGELVEDKRLGIWNRLLVSPLTKYQLYFGNLCYAFLLSLFQIGMLIIAGKLLFGVPWGENLAPVLFLFAFYILAICSLGIFLTAFVKTPQQLHSIVPIIAVSTSMIGGAFWPLEIINSQVLLFLAKLTPQSWTISALKSLVLQNQGFEAVWLPVAVLSLMAVVFSGIGLTVIEKKPSSY